MQSDSNAIQPFVADAAFRAGAVEGLLLASEAPDDRYEFFGALRTSVLSSLELGDPASPLPPPSLFIRALRPREAAEQFGPSSVVIDIDLRDPQQWQGKLVFAAQHGTGGWAVEMPGSDLGHAIKALIDGGLGEAPIATVYATKRVISCAVEGAAAGALTLKLSLPASSRTISIKDIDEVLEIVRQEGFITPAVCPPNLWTDPANYIPGTETERLLQWCVAQEMRAHFRPILAEREQVTAIGRIDICLTDPNATDPAQRHPAVVELKALRSKSSTGGSVSERTNLAAVAGGMRQAKSYRVKKNALLGVLACFDLRKSKTDLLSNVTVQKAQGRYYDERMAVTLLPIYGLPEDAQDEIAAA